MPKSSITPKRLSHRRATLRQKLGAATTPLQRVAAATDFMRGALAQADPALADREADRLVAYLTEVGERLLAGQQTGKSS